MLRPGARFLSFACFLLLPATALAALPPSLQLGSLPLDAQGRGFAVAVPLEGHAKLIDPPAALSLLQRDGQPWLVAEPVAPGPFSALLEWRDASGTVRRTMVAGEVVDSNPSLLLVADRGPIRRALRMIGRAPIRDLDLAGAEVELLPPDARGWQDLEVRPAPGRTELRGELRLVDDTSVPAQVSLAEVVSVLGSTWLPTGVRWSDVIPLRERIGARELRARIALRGRFQGRRVLSLRNMASTPNGVRFSALGNLLLPPPPEGSPSAALGLRVPEPAMLYLAGRDARFIDLRQGILDVETFADLRYERAVVSPLDPATVFAVRRNEDGKLRFARWSVRADGGTPSLRPRRIGPPLRDVFGVRDLVVHDLRARKFRRQFPARPVRERILLLASPTQPGAESLSPRILGLRLDFRQQGLRDAGVLWKSGPSIPVGGIDPRMSLLPSFRAGSGGYPVTVRVDYPDLRYGRRLVRDQPGERFGARYNVGRRSARFQTLGRPLSPPRYLSADTDGSNTFLRRFVQGSQEPALGAEGILQGVRPLQLRASSLRSRAYLLTESANGRALRLLEIGLAAGTNLPPRVDVGPDLRVRATSPDGARVQLRARTIDANGDPLAIRWSGAGVRFQDRFAARTQAVVPPGVVQVRARVRERGGKAVQYEASDLRTFTVETVVAAPSTPSLATKLVSIAPNPANPRVRISFTLANSGPARVRVLDARGRLVRELLNERRALGAHELMWDGKDDTGVAAASGVYFVELGADGTLDTRRLALVR